MRPTIHAPIPIMHIWLLSPYQTGSHQSWSENYQRYSQHKITLLTMAGRFWKWRMQGGAIELAAQARSALANGAPDAIVATDMVNLPVWLGLLRGDLPRDIPILYYMHENQLTYPWRPGEKPDLTYAMFNWTSQICADRIAFNSHYHMQSWFDEVPRLLKHFPDYNHLPLIDDARAKSIVLPVGIRCDRLMPANGPAQSIEPDAANWETRPTGQSPLIVWNQRWEYDKRPDLFFNLLYRLADAGVPFQLAVAGENFRNIPSEFEEAHQRLRDHIVHWGYLDSYTDYVNLLHRADLVISTAIHEFFGISILEAIVAGAFPLLPNRLSYPELIPDALHPACLYDDEDDLFAKTQQRLQALRSAPPSLRNHIMAEYDWEHVAARYDAELAELCSRQG
ncbi:MAG: DUF3524 domain-containing protein [Caldilineaceae bacterium]|nr:DUF3524 domain-containing protein [Caldilineaceae bacterium]